MTDITIAVPDTQAIEAETTALVRAARAQQVTTQDEHRTAKAALSKAEGASDSDGVRIIKIDTSPTPAFLARVVEGK